jgi:type II secretory pathway pseudopilin PulG
MELLLVLALLTVLAALTVPAMRGWQQRLTLERAATALQHQISETRLRSIRSGERWMLVLSLSEKTSLQIRPDRPLNQPELLRLPQDIRLKPEPEKGPNYFPTRRHMLRHGSANQRHPWQFPVPFT